MRRAGIRGVARRKKGTTRRGPDVVPSDDLVCRQFGVDGPDVLWVADTGEHPTAEGKVYLAVVIDAWNRECIGWSIADHLRAELVCDAFDMARWQQPARTRLRAHPPCRPRNPIHLLGVRPQAPPGRHPRVDGNGRRRPGQRHGRILLRHPSGRTAGPAPLGHPPPARPGDLRIHRSLLQPRTEHTPPSTTKAPSTIATRPTSRWHDQQTKTVRETGGSPSSPTTPPDRQPMPSSRTVTCSPRRSAVSATDSATPTTIGDDSSDASASHGILTPPHEYEAANHDSSRRPR